MYEKYEGGWMYGFVVFSILFAVEKKKTDKCWIYSFSVRNIIDG